MTAFQTRAEAVFRVEFEESAVPTVHLWSSVQMPFEGATAASIRRELRPALQRLPGTGHLSASLSAPSLWPGSDIENVLLYNIGSGSFTHVAHRSVSLERDLEPAIDGNGVRWAFHHQYVAPSAPLFQSSQRDGVLVRLALPRLTQLFTGKGAAAAYWAAALESRQTDDLPSLRGQRFRLAIRVGGPTSRLNLVSLMKPMIDGLVCALHSFSGQPSAELVARVASACGADSNTVAQWLSQGAAPLGGAGYLLLRGHGLQWSPPDDNFNRITITYGARDDDAGLWDIELELSPSEGP